MLRWLRQHKCVAHKWKLTFVCHTHMSPCICVWHTNENWQLCATHNCLPSNTCGTHLKISIFVLCAYANGGTFLKLAKVCYARILQRPVYHTPDIIYKNVLCSGQRSFILVWHTNANFQMCATRIWRETIVCGTDMLIFICVPHIDGGRYMKKVFLDTPPCTVALPLPPTPSNFLIGQH